MAEDQRGRLGSVVRGYRRRAGLTQREAALRAEISTAGLRDVEQGRVLRPRVSTLRKLAAVLGMSRLELEELIREAEGEQQSGSGLRVEVLGPLRVSVDGRGVDPGSETQRVLLGMLALTPNKTVARDSLIEAVWGAESAAAAQDLLQSRMSRLRRRLQPDAGTTDAGTTDAARLLVAHNGGYQLNVADAQHDLLSFRRLLALARQARKSGRQAEECDLLSDAVKTWRGEPLEGLAALQQHPIVGSLSREFRGAVVDYATVAAELGRYQEPLPFLQRLAVADPVDEAVHAGLMIALAGNGQQAAALGVFDTLRRRLANELGADPGPELVSAHQRVLRQEVSRPEFTPASAHRQLPADIGHFCGRAAELAALRGTVSAQHGMNAGRVVLIEGMGGVGKTRLAIQLAHRLVAEGNYTDCQLYVDLRGHADQPPADPSAVLASFLRLLGVPDEQVPASMDERASLFRDRLYGRQALILLDNAAGEDQVLPLLPAGADNLTLITSRRALALDGAQIVALDLFTAAEAEELLANVIGRERVAAEPVAARNLAELCGRLPLAVALAARRLQTRPAWTIADLVSRLMGRPGRLRELVAGSRRLQAVFDLSYQALQHGERRMFRLLGLHSGNDFTVGSAAALAGVAPRQALDLLDRLVDEHLITVVTRDRYRMHDLLDEYAAEMAAGDVPPQQREEAITRLLDFYLHSSVRATSTLRPDQPGVHLDGPAPVHLPEFPSRDEAKRWLDAERACLVGAVGLAAGQGWMRHAWKLTRSLREYLNQYGYSRDLDWVRTHEAALAASIASGDPVAEALTRTDLAAAYTDQGRSEEAREHLYRALELHRAEGDAVLEAITFSSVAFVCYRLGEFREALTHFQQGAALLAGRDPLREGVLLINVGIALLPLGRVEEALDSFRRGTRLAKRLGNVEVECGVLARLGDAYRRIGRHSLAIEHLKDALALAERNELVPMVASARHYLGNVYRELGAMDDAVINLDGAMLIMRSVSLPASDSEVEILVDTGATYRDIGDLATAYDLLDEALRMAITRRERFQQARALDELAELHRSAARSEIAYGHWRQAYEIFAELGTPEASRLSQFAPELSGSHGRIDSVA